MNGVLQSPDVYCATQLDRRLTKSFVLCGNRSYHTPLFPPVIVYQFGDLLQCILTVPRVTESLPCSLQLQQKVYFKVILIKVRLKLQAFILNLYLNCTFLLACHVFQSGNTDDKNANIIYNKNTIISVAIHQNETRELFVISVVLLRLCHPWDVTIVQTRQKRWSSEQQSGTSSRIWRRLVREPVLHLKYTTSNAKTASGDVACGVC